MKPALLVVDVQQKFFAIGPTAADSLHQAIPGINEAIAFFRKKGLPVVVVQHVDTADGLIPGKPEFEVSPLLDILPTDPRIHKTYGNAFNKTDLETMLRGMGVDTVVISGFCAEYCVLSTFRGALDCDFIPALLRRTLASINPTNIPFVENVNDTISLNMLKKVLE